MAQAFSWGCSDTVRPEDLGLAWEPTPWGSFGQDLLLPSWSFLKPLCHLQRPWKQKRCCPPPRATSISNFLPGITYRPLGPVTLGQEGQVTTGSMTFMGVQATLMAAGGH